MIFHAFSESELSDTTWPLVLCSTYTKGSSLDSRLDRLSACCARLHTKKHLPKQTHLNSHGLVPVFIFTNGLSSCPS